MPALWTKTFPDQHKKLMNPGSAHRARRLAIAKATRRREAKPCKRISKKRSRENPIYLRESRARLLEFPWCERCLAKGAKVPATCTHHWAGREWNFLKKEFWKSSCHPCNMFAKNEPAAAREEGWIAPVGTYATH